MTVPYDFERYQHDPKAVEAAIPEIAGKTIASARQEAGDFHDLDEGYAQDGPVVVEFTDGTRLIVRAFWRNDGTASIEYQVRSADEGSRP